MGGPGDSRRYFDLIVTLADEKTNQEIRNLMYKWWCSKNFTDDRFQDLPDGVHETHRITIKRSDSTGKARRFTVPIELNHAGPVDDHDRDICERFDIVDHGRFSPQAGNGG